MFILQSTQCVHQNSASFFSSHCIDYRININARNFDLARLLFFYLLFVFLPSLPSFLSLSFLMSRYLCFSTFIYCIIFLVILFSGYYKPDSGRSHADDGTNSNNSSTAVDVGAAVGGSFDANDNSKVDDNSDGDGRFNADDDSEVDGNFDNSFKTDNSSSNDPEFDDGFDGDLELDDGSDGDDRFNANNIGSGIGVNNDNIKCKFIL